MVETKLTKRLAKQINKKFTESLQNYRKITSMMSGDLPIGCLCLDKATEKILVSNGFLRVYDIFDVDLTKIKGLGTVRVGNITASLDKFLFVC